MQAGAVSFSAGAVSFGDVLDALGARDTEPVETSRYWDFYRARYPTPGGDVTASYLYLAHDCPLQEANSTNLSLWRGLTRGAPYTAVVTRKSRLAADLPKTASQFRARIATTSRTLLFENVLSNLVPHSQRVEKYQYFIEPDISLPQGETKLALTYLIEDLLSGSSDSEAQICADILVAPAGLGKTTLARALAKRLLESDRQAIPVLIESAQWQNLINLTLPNILNAALLQLMPEAGRLTNAKTFQLLVREQLLVPIFDGFDELCSHPNSNYNPATLIEELVDLVGDAGAKVLITTRETYWEKFGTGIAASKIKRFDLRGFSNDQRQRFFAKRLKDLAERDIANRLAKEIGNTLYEANFEREPLQAERASGVPLLLELIAIYVEGNPHATFAPTSKDPIGPLLEAVCERENERQKLAISADKQMMIFEELFRDFHDDIQRTDLALYVEYNVPGIDPGALDRFESHAFFSPGKDVCPRFETLRVYFVARWLSNRLENVESDETIAQILERNSAGNTDVFDFLVNRFLAIDENTVRAALPHALKMVQARQRWEGASSAIFHLAQRLAQRLAKTKAGRTDLLLDYLGIGVPIRRIAVIGQIGGLDLSKLIFENCVFKDVEFYNCTFGDGTQFVKSRFDGSLKFENCAAAGLAKVIDCFLSDAAQEEWDIQAGRASSQTVSRNVARTAAREALRKFIGPYGFSSIKFADRNSGILSKNPCRDQIWNELIKEGIVISHRISGVTEGGLKLIDTPDVRHEVRNFLDNAILGPRLIRVIESLMRHS